MSDVVVLKARRAALEADARAAASRRAAVAVVAAAALIIVAILVMRGLIGAAWLALPGAIAAVVAVGVAKASMDAKAKFTRLQEQLEAAEKAESESVSATLAKRLAKRKLETAPETVETVEFESEPVRVEGGWTPMPVPQPLYAAAPARIQRRKIDVSQVVAQLQTADEAREIYRPRQLQGISGVSSEEAAATAPARLDVNSAIDRRRAASF